MKHDFPNKILFLDVDGVINIPPYNQFDPDCLDFLEYIISNTDAKIVVSSSWRDWDSQRMRAAFLEKGFPEELFNQIIDITVHGYRYVKEGSNLPIVRGNEIKQWVDTKLVYPWHSDKSLDKVYRINNEDGSFKIMASNKVGKDFQYIILDDDSDMLYEQKDNFIHLDGLKGITMKDAESAITVLNNIKSE